MYCSKKATADSHWRCHRGIFRRQIKHWAGWEFKIKAKYGEHLKKRQTFLSKDTKNQNVSVQPETYPQGWRSAAAQSHQLKNQFWRSHRWTHLLTDSNSQWNLSKGVQILPENADLQVMDHVPHTAGKCCIRLHPVYDGTGVNVTSGRCFVWKLGLLENASLTRKSAERRKPKEPPPQLRESRE